MREIKFRAKRLDNGEWSYGSGLLIADDFCVIDRDTEMYVDEKYEWAGNTHFFRVAGVMCDLKTICQYTGLKDKNGKEIYEGDILRIEEFRNESGPIEKSEEFYEVFDLEDMKGEKQREYTSSVSWEDGAFVISVNRKGDTDLSVLFGDMRLSFPIFIFEVIGNIYDNPELVEG